MGTGWWDRESAHNSRLCVEGSRKAGFRTGLKDEKKFGTELTMGKTNPPDPVCVSHIVPSIRLRSAWAVRRGPKMSWLLH